MSPIQISIKDYKAVKSAEIDLNGITVISGINGSGKSSISRLLYYALKYANNFDEIVNRLFENDLVPINLLLQSATTGFQNNGIVNEIRKCIKEIGYVGDNKNKRRIYIKALELVGDLLKSANPKEEPMAYRLMGIIESGILKNNSFSEYKISSVHDVIKKTELLFDKAENLSLLRKYSLYYDALTDVLEDTIKGVKILEYGVPFVGKSVTSVPILNYIQRVAYIDTPMMVGIDAQNNVEYWNDLNTMLDFSIKANHSRTIEKYLNEIIGGNVYLKNEKSFWGGTMKYLRNDGLEIDLINSATGIKSFSILQRLLQNGTIKENTLLIIDEPEAHLHPQWIVEYARIIVMMHQRIGAKFFIASHSTDFVSAIKYIAEKQKVQKSLSFYLAEEDKRKPYSYNYKSIGTDIEPIFESFNKSLDKISEYGGW